MSGVLVPSSFSRAPEIKAKSKDFVSVMKIIILFSGREFRIELYLSLARPSVQLKYNAGE